jgi:hypothetical protein
VFFVGVCGGMGDFGNSENTCAPAIPDAQIASSRRQLLRFMFSPA